MIEPCINRDIRPVEQLERKRVVAQMLLPKMETTNLGEEIEMKRNSMSFKYQNAAIRAKQKENAPHAKAHRSVFFYWKKNQLIIIVVERYLMPNPIMIKAAKALMTTKRAVSSENQHRFFLQKKIKYGDRSWFSSRQKKSQSRICDQ